VIEVTSFLRDDCKKAIAGAAVVFHLAAGRGEKSYAGSYMNSVVTTRNLLEPGVKGNSLKRFVNISSFAVYSNEKLKRGEVLDEGCQIESQPVSRERGVLLCKSKARRKWCLNITESMEFRMQLFALELSTALEIRESPAE